MMPLAFDLISTFVIGSIFPVATTDRAITPRSTVASLESGRSADDPYSADTPHAAAAITAATAAP